VDTITHELIHAEFNLEGPCMAAGSRPAPLGGAATIDPPKRADLAALGIAGGVIDAALTASVGPGASNPCGEFLDENAAAQQIIARVMQSNITVTHVGLPTVTFVNLIIRGNPAALAFYTSCRSTACAKPVGPARVAAITDCSQRTIATFIPPAMTPSLLPTRVDFDTNSHALRPDARETLHLVALFLTSHPGTTVNLTGRTDASGSVAANMVLGQARANAVKAFLLGEGVPAAQIGTVTSTGETGSSHSGRAGFAERSVEIAP
jgi:outer membrane protein OmpA-like peptidoglycan-associated protein